MPINKVVLDDSPTGKNLVKVTFTPPSPRPARQHSIEAVFQVKRLDGYYEDKEPFSVFLLSCTRTDTREPYNLSESQRDMLVEAAIEAAAEEM